MLLGGCSPSLGASAVLVAAGIAVSASGGTTPKQPAPPASATFRGIPEHDGVLGDPKAPLTLTEYVDLQCPVCAEASKQTLPWLVKNYVRTGQGQARAAHAALHRPGLRARRARGRRGRAAGPAVAVHRGVLRGPGSGELGLRDRQLPALGLKGRRRRRRQGADRGRRRVRACGGSSGPTATRPGWA